VVQGPLTGSQVVVPQRSTPLESGTHGTPPQQSELSAHVSPAARHVPIPLQRGTPSGSSSQSDFTPRNAQQSLRVDETPHVVPAGNV